MNVQFTPCAACSRHVRRGDLVCPFCGGANASAESAPTRTIAGRLSRAALFAAGAMGVAVATTECSSAPQPAYGGSFGQPAPTDATVSEGASSVADGSTDSGDGTVPESADSSDDSPATAPGPIGFPAYGSPIPVYGSPIRPEE